MADEPKNDEAAEPDTDGTTEETPQAESSAKKPAAKKKAAAKKTAKKKPAAAKAEADEAQAEEAGDAPAEAVAEAATDEPAAEAEDKPKRKPAAKKAAAKKAAAKPAAAAEESQPAEKAKPSNGDRPTVRAHAKYVRTSARKARLVCDHIRGKDVDEARAILAHTQRAVARDWSKLLESAIANAEHNHELVGEDLKILSVTADEGPTLKRFQPRAMGRATKIRKRTSHLTITLTPKD